MVDFTLAFAMVHELPAAAHFFREVAAASKPGARVLFVERPAMSRLSSMTPNCSGPRMPDSRPWSRLSSAAATPRCSKGWRPDPARRRASTTVRLRAFGCHNRECLHSALFDNRVLSS
jgi:hypothetical protein